MAVNVAPFKLKSATKDNVAQRNNVPYKKPQRKLTLKEMQAREYPFLDSDVPGIFDDLLEANLIDLPEMKRPEEAERKDDPKYCKYHRLVGHAIQDCFVFKDKVMQLARQGKISLEEDSATTNVITIKSGHIDGNKDPCNATHGDNITSNEDTLFEKEDSSDTDDCMSTITFTDEDLLLGSKPHNRPLFVAGYINMKQPSKPPLKGFVPSTREEEGGHEALAIDEKGFDPKAFKLLIKAGYDPKEKLNLGKRPPEAPDDKESVASSNYISNSVEENIVQTYHITLIEDGEVEEEDAEDAPAELEEGIKATIDELKEVNLGDIENPRPIYISATNSWEEGTYIALLHEFKDVFAWSYKEMSGLDPKVAVHHLSVKKGARTVKQGQRRFRPELIPLIEGEVNKLIEVGFIREVKYPMWISSIVPVRKKNGQIRVCVDFRDLNNACPKMTSHYQLLN
ncbi:UNVERIFIED_CONTAM: hypothetical protein Sangu_0797000 [Sesamum angustifolium]|uniref:Uncharacterized protein n=1 Tax=Sesamum angustifolium TaxID=2727405 RepID=A0AAW2PVI5_9LAMI